MAQLKVTQIKSKIGGNQAQRDSLRSLGLRRIGQSVVKPDRPEFRGMIQTVRHLVTVEEVRLTWQRSKHGDEQGRAGRGLKLHHLRPAPGAHTAKTRVGRGEASKGKTAGRGTKGTKARNTGAGRLRGRPDAAAPPAAEAQGLLATCGSRPPTRSSTSGRLAALLPGRAAT